MMEPNYPMAFHEEDDEKYIEKEKDRSTNLAIDSDSSNIDSCSVVTPKVCSGTSGGTNKKASILKSPLLRLTRTKKRSSGAVVKENGEQIPIINSSSSGTNGSSSNNENSSASKCDKTKINDTILEENTSGCEKEDHMHCHDNDTYNNVSTNPIDYDDDDINVNVNVNDRGKLNMSDIESDEEELKNGLETNRRSNSHIKNKDLPLKSRPLHASTNLSIVVTRNEVVVEYRDKDQEGGGQKQSSPDLQPSVGRDEATTLTSATSESNYISSTSTSTSTSKRYIVRKGIMKRPRDSNIAYHHPQKPNHPPPGYDVKSLWRKDYTANSTTDREYLHQRIRSQPSKRVSFDEVSLTEQFQLSQLRRQTRHKRRGVFDMLAMAMPVILPYLIAISILLASSLVPLPQSPSLSSSQPKVITPSEKEVEILPNPPIIFDLASRMWDERKLQGATKIPNSDDTKISSNEDNFTGRTGKDNINRQLFDARKKSIPDIHQQISTGCMGNKRKNLIGMAVATISDVIDKRNSKTNTCSDSTASQGEGREVATKNKNSTFQKRNLVVRVLSGFMKILARILFPFRKIQKT